MIRKGLRRRRFLGRAGILALGALSSGRLFASARARDEVGEADIAIVNAKIHTMDGRSRVVEQALIQNGRFTAVGNRVDLPRKKVR